MGKGQQEGISWDAWISQEVGVRLLIVENPIGMTEVVNKWLEGCCQILEFPWEAQEWEDVDVDGEVGGACEGENNGEEVAVGDPTLGKDNAEDCLRVGAKNGEGSVTLRWDNGDTFSGSFEDGVRSGWGCVTSKSKGIASLTGDWQSGLLTGRGTISRDDSSKLEGRFKGSQMHGLARRTEVKKFRTFRQQVTWLGRFKGGKPTGRIWEWKEGGGWLIGFAAANGRVSGEAAFLFPDLRTALVGRWNEDGQMASGRKATLESAVCKNGICAPQFSVPDGPEVSHSRSTQHSIGPAPLVPDPYESSTVEVRCSQVEGGGEGLYARRSLAKGEIVAFYNGIRLPPEHREGTPESWETSGYKIFANTGEVWGERMDIPVSHLETSSYSATLGHKVNHCFVYNCTEWFFDHPRHGLIPCTRATRDIAAGEELFLHYGYDPRNCPSWYREALDVFLDKNPDLTEEEVANPERMEEEKRPFYNQMSFGLDNGCDR